MDQTDPTFPPLLRGVGVEGEPGPFERACADAAAGAAEAGVTCWGRSTSNVELAIVLEPEVSAATSMQMLIALMVGFGDAFGAIGPPEVGMFYRWPMALIINDARIGEMRAALPAAAAEGNVPDWLVVGLRVRLSREDLDYEPGHDLENTTLDQEGCGEITRTALIESVARHFLVWVHTWNEEGFKPVHDAWLPRAEGYNGQVTVNLSGSEHNGEFIGLDDEANMLMKLSTGKTIALPLLDAVERV